MVIRQPPDNDGAWGDDIRAAVAGVNSHEATLATQGATLATKAADSAVVHNSGAETVAGVKTFSSSPIVPAPTTSGQAAPKSYVDAVVAGGGIPTTIVDAKGDLVAATANDTVVRLPVGAAGQVLKVDSTTATGLIWATPATGSGSGVSGWFDVTAYGATGNGSTDDTASIQSAVNAALLRPGATVYFPPPPSGGTYIVTDTIKLYNAASSQNQYHVNILANLPWNGITYTGASNKIVFDSRGLKYSTITGLNVTVQGSMTNIVVWNLDVGVFGSVNYTSTGENDFNNCYFSVNGSATLIGWRLSYSSNSADISQVAWRNCNIFGDQGTAAGSRTSIGWQSCGSNTLNISFYSCSMAFCSAGWTTIPGSGAAGTGGGDSMYFYGCGGSYNDIDFQLKTTGNYLISGGRWEVGRQLLSCPQGGGYTGLLTVTMNAVEIETYTPPSGKLIDIGSSCILNMTGCVLHLISVAATAALITVAQGASGFGSVLLSGCSVPDTAPNPFITTTGGTWVTHARSCVRVSTSNLSLSMIDY